jgi:putative phosphoesterase
MTIGIVSDTHGYFHPELPDVFAGVDLILHAGDLGSVEVLEGFEAVAPTRAVWGNVDDQAVRQRVPKHQRLVREDLSLWMTHIGGRPGNWDSGVRSRLQQDPPDIFICGHSHMLQIERIEAFDQMLFINPGAAGREGMHQEKTCVRLLVADGTASEAEVIHLDQ